MGCWRTGVLVLEASFVASIVGAQTLASVTPSAQRVHEYIELTGSGFGNTQGSSRVRFTDATVTVDAGRAYLWRDNYIRVRVPVGNRIAGVITPIPKTPLLVFVRTSAGTSNMLSFQVIAVTGGTLAFRQLTNIAANHADLSSVLGSPNENSARTKDAEVADVNADGYPDLLDNNSNNENNGTHSVLRLNNHDRSFTARWWEPLTGGESGTFAVSIPSSGDFFGDHTSYDADFADLTGDRLPDLIHTAADNVSGTAPGRIRLLINNAGGVPGSFTEETSARMPIGALGSSLCPDDVDHADIDNDGDVDFAVTLRTAPTFCGGDTSHTRVFLNQGAGTFAAPLILSAPTDISTHDVFFLDANDDGFQDAVLCHEWNNATGSEEGVQSRLFLNNANPASPGFTGSATFALAATTGDSADFNGDGLPDFVIGRTGVSMFLNIPASPGVFTESVLLAPAGNAPFYDFEMGDLNLDGWVDIVGVIVNPPSVDATRIWLNNGDATFTEITAGSTPAVLPGHGSYQRLSADLLDMDRDGDLELYLTGNDGQDTAPSGVGFGRGPNQLYENLIVGLNILYPRQVTPAYAGSAAGGHKVLVRLATPVPASMLTPTSFVVAVDGADLMASATVTGGRISEEFWLLVQMPAKPDGCYSMQIRLASDPAIRDAEPQSLCYEGERQFDRALVIDRSGSMLWDSTAGVSSPEKMEAARAAGSFFVDLSADVDEIGVTSFKRDSDDGDGVVEQSELAQTDFPMVPAQVGGTDNRPAARGVVGGLQPDGQSFSSETSIGAGLREGLAMLNSSADPGHERQIVLITDGRENYGPYWSREGDGGPLKPIVQAASPPVTVHTVSIGRDANAEVVQDIATSTGGLFFNLYEGAGSYGLMSRLASVYKRIDEEMRDEQRFFYREGVPPLVPVGPGGGFEPATHLTYGRVAYFHVADGFESLSVGFHWNLANGIRGVELRGPDGAVITHAPPLRLLHADPRHRTYRIADPVPGWYRYQVDTGASDSLEFFATASGITDLVAKGRVGAVQQTGPGTYRVPLRVVIGDAAPALHANVHGQVSLPDKTKVPITLLDDGAHTDGRNLDAIYGVEFSHWMPGGYFVDLTAEGVSSRGEPYTRHVSFSFVFPGTSDQEETPDDAGTRDPWPALGLSLHVGSTHPLGSLNRQFDANVYLRLDASYRLSPRWRLVAMAGLAQTTADQSSGSDNVFWNHASLNVQARVPLPSGLWAFAQMGPGAYRHKGAGVSLGMNLGLGGQVPLPGPFLLEFGADYHRLFGERRAEFLTAQLGVAFGWGRRTDGRVATAPLQKLSPPRSAAGARPAAFLKKPD